MPKKIIENDEIKNFSDALKNVIGDNIRKPITARLGFKDTNGSIYIKVPPERTDQPNKYYFHEAGGNSFQGIAFLQPGALKDWQIRYGTPIRVRKDPISKEWEIFALDMRYAEQFFDNVTQDDLIVYDYSKLSPGLLTTTEPNSMKAKVLAGAYRLGEELVYIETKNTVDWSESPYINEIPSNPQKAKYVLVQINFNTKLIEYKYGNEFPSQLSFTQVDALDDNTQTYIPKPDSGKFRAGYIKLNYGINVIKRTNIIPLQEYLSIQSPDAGQSALDTVITWDGNVVVDGVTGNLIYGRII
jgi:hypothetical protein